MLRVDIRQARPGMALAMPVHNPKTPAQTLLRMGYVLSEAVIGKLDEMGIRTLWVRYPSLSFLEEFIHPEIETGKGRLIGEVASVFEAVQGDTAARLPYHQYTGSIRELVNQLITHPRAAVFLGDLATTDNKLLRHSANVAYLALLMGLKLEGYLVRERPHVNPGRAKEVVNLGLGALLHDIGETLIDPDASAHHQLTGDTADPAWQEHTAAGYRLVRGQVEPSAATIVLHHHQAFDGSGFAGKGFPVLRGRAIHVFARIAAAADQFDRLRHPPGLDPRPTVWALSGMLARPTANRFDPQVLRTLVDLVPPYAPGSVVRLSDGQHAVVLAPGRDDPCRPEVMLIPPPEQLDPSELPPGPRVDLLAAPPSLYIAEAEGQDVGELNFPAAMLPAA